MLGLALVATIASARSADAQRALERLSSLQGRWHLTEGAIDTDATFETIARGHAVLEKNEGFAATYYLDGDTLMMTLFTSDGVQPRFRSTGLTDGGTAIAFTLVDMTNLAPGGGYINSLALDLSRTDVVTETWGWHDEHGVDSSFDIVLRRAAR
jgi:hypothetical protein